MTVESDEREVIPTLVDRVTWLEQHCEALQDQLNVITTILRLMGVATTQLPAAP